ncbi:hypothetical protein ACO0LF_14205 [Undibacterium sp. Di27W]|uniref:hypothetical protein n=1 Tax=Undibacterium sp. Di27W TaxID=3413036 RepID=UPI003BF04E1C
MMKLKSKLVLTLSIFLSACGGGSGGGTATAVSPGTASGSDGATQLACTNKFGRTWTAIDNDSSKPRVGYFSNVVYGNGVFLGGIKEYGYSLWSKDGENWTISSPSAYHGSGVVTYALGKFITLNRDSSGNLIVSSTTDGASWDKKIIAQTSANSSSTLPSFYPSDLVSGNGRLIVVGSNNKIIWTTDSQTWNLAANINDLKVAKDYDFNWAAFAKGKFYTTTSADPRMLYVSTDGNIWQAQKISGDGVFPTAVITGMQYLNGLYIAVDANGVIANSSDSVNWKTVLRGNMSPIIYGNQLVIGAGQVMTIDYQKSYDYAEVAYSCDGVTWAKTKFESGNFINTVAIGDNVAVRAGVRASFSKF